jgi:hypothetical protein
MTDTSKRTKRLLREWAAEAHEEELRRTLLPLAELFRTVHPEVQRVTNF